MRRSLKISVWVCAAAILLVLVFGGAVMVAGNTDTGRALIERWTYRLSAGYVKLSGLGGSFPTQLTLGKLELIDSGGVWLTAERLSVTWSPLKLLERRIGVDTLRAARVDFERAPISQGHGGSASIPDIEVGRFSLDAVKLGAPLVGTAASLSLQGTLRLRSLDDAAADLLGRRLDGDGEYTLHLRFDAKRMDATLALHEPAGGPLENLLSLPGLGALSATATLQGPRDAERVDLSIGAGQLHAAVRGSVDLTHGSADLEYSLTAPSMAPRSDLGWTAATLQGNWHGSLTAPKADGRLAIDGLRIAGTRTSRLTADLVADAGKLAVHAVVEKLQIPGPQPGLFAKDPLRVDASLMLDEASRPLELSATHPLLALQAHTETRPDKSASLSAAIQLKLPDLAPFAVLAGQDVSGCAVIGARWMHRPGDDSLSLESNVDLSGGTAGWIGYIGPRVVLQLSGDLTDKSIKIGSLRIAGRALTLAANGSATRAAAAPNGGKAATGLASFIGDLDARWQLGVSDLATVSSDVTGDLKVSGRLRGTATSMMGDADLTSRLSVRGSPSGTVQASLHARGLPTTPSGTLQAHGMVDGAPLNIDATIERSGGSIFRMLVRQADWKSAHTEGDATADAQLNDSSGQLHMQIGQLSDFDRLLGLSLDGSVEARLGFVPAQGRTRAQFQVDAKDLQVGRFGGDLHLTGTGASDALALQMTMKLPNLYGKPASFSSAATLDLDTRELRIAGASLDYRGESVRLLSPAQLSFSKGLVVDELKLGAQDAIVQLKGQLAPTLDLTASLQQLKPELVNVFAPGLLASGTIEAQARLQGSPSAPTGRVRLDAGDIRFADDAATGLPALEMHARAQLAGDSASMNAELTAGSGSRLTASGTVPLDASGAYTLKIDGKLDVGLANPLLEARGLRAAGQLGVDATVTGSGATPQVGGGITLAGGSLRDYGRGVNLSNISAEVVGSEGALRIKTFKATAASGSLDMTGTFGVLQAGMPVDLRITAKNAQPIASSIITANLDADLHVGGKARERIDVGGTVQVNKATIGIPDSLPPDVAVLDVRRRGQGAPVAADKPLIIGLDLTIKAPRQILVQGRGIDAEFGGEIKVAGTSDAPLTSGGFDLQRGTFTIAGSTLNFTTGSRVGFDGAGLSNKIDPTLDFTASTTLANGSTATLHITGVADAPRFDFTSSSGLAQDEIMSQLLFGENAAQLTSLQAAQIGVALATLTGVGSGGLNPLVKLQKTLGLDRLTVAGNTTTTPTGATENSGAAIAAGRYVSKRVYVEAKQTTTGNSQVQVNVDLTKHLKLQTRLGNGTAVTQGTTPENDPGSSVGLSYQFEY